MKRALILPVVLAASYAIWWYMVADHQLQFGAQAEPVESNFLIVAYGYVITLLGVIIGSTYRELQKMREFGRRDIGKPSVLIKKVCLSIDLWTGIVASPVVYALIWKSLDTSNVAGLTVIALQNGFCCTMIASNLLGRTSTPPDPEASSHQVQPRN